ncbi:unnamed protein product [Ixodes pacificus]
MAAWILVWVLCLAWAWATPLDTAPDTSPARSPSLRVVGTRLEVDFGPADPGAQLLLLLLLDPGQGCLSPRALVSRRENITVSGPAANVSSLHPVEVGRSPPATATLGGCSSWNATIVVTASYTSSWVEADVQVHQWPRCPHQFRVALWEVLQPPGPGEEPCVFDIAPVQEVQRSLDGVNSSVVHFENMTAGNYCVRVSTTFLPLPARESCAVSRPSAVWHLRFGPSALDSLQQSVIKPRARATLVQQRRKASLIAVAIKYLMAACTPGQRCARVPVISGIQHERATKITLVFLIFNNSQVCHKSVWVWHYATALQTDYLGKQYSRTGPDVHGWNVSKLLEARRVLLAAVETVSTKLLYEKLGIVNCGAVYTNRGTALPSPQDVGLSSGSMWDDLYHTTYTALLSRQAQALGDYCHILVARFSYSPSSPRLDLVPEKRYVLPTHTRELLEALLHGWMDEKDVPARIQNVCASDAHTHFQEALMNACNTLEENPGLVRDRFKAIADC